MTLLVILGILFVTLAIAVTVLEKSSFRMSDQDISKWSRWIWPLLVILLAVQLIQMMF